MRTPLLETHHNRRCCSTPSVAATAPASRQWRRDRLKNGAGSAAGDARTKAGGRPSAHSSQPTTPTA